MASHLGEVARRIHRRQAALPRGEDNLCRSASLLEEGTVPAAEPGDLVALTAGTLL
jgi:hypothetical protein